MNSRMDLGSPMLDGWLCFVTQNTAQCGSAVFWLQNTATRLPSTPKIPGVGSVGVDLGGQLVAPAKAATVESKIVWLEGKPNIELSIDAKPIEPAKPLVVPLTLFDAQNARLWQTQLSILTTGPAPWRLTAPLEKIVDVKKQHRVEFVVRDTDRDLNYAARLTFVSEKATVPWFGIYNDGNWPQRKVGFLLPLPAFKGQTREIPVAITVRDGDDAVAFQRELRLTPTEMPQLHRLDVTPDTATSVGPYSVEIDVDSESHGLSFRTSERFAQPNAEVPLSSFEHGDNGLWFVADGQPQRYQTLQYYYSEHLKDFLPRDYPHVAYDTAEKHSGRQALRVDYESGREGYVWSRQILPGKPLAMSIWVKGNETDDQLIVHFEDHINFTLPAWQRNANFEQAVICTLNFAGWRQFTVPVLGGGLQASGTKGSTVEIDGPVKILALTVRTVKPKGKEKEPAEPRRLWIDDLSVQTQISANARLSIETQLNRTDGELAAGAVLSVSVGNGQPAKLAKGKLTLTARDVEGQGVWTKSVDLPVEERLFATVNVPLDELVQRQPRGPVDLDVTFTDPTVSGARISKRLTLKRPMHAGIVFDFEQVETFNGFQPGKVTASHSKVVAGGADGSAHSLALAVVAKQEDNSVLLHPALPGKLDRVEVMIQGGAKPIQLQPWFIDSGSTGIWTRNYNLFWAEPITVDWTGWKKVTINAPPIPAYHAEKNRSFLFEPAYPLNLAFNAKLLDGDEPVELRMDNIRVQTHLAATEVQQLEIEYPDETRLHVQGSPLVVSLTNFAPEPATFDLQFALHHYQGFVAKQGKQSMKLAAGQRQRVTLVEQLPAGVYDVEVQGFGKDSVRLPIIVLDMAKFFGNGSATAMLSDPLSLRRSLGLMTERLYLDWDNVEPAPYMRHFYWFDQESKKRRELPVLPEQLKPFLEKQQAAMAALTQLEGAVKASQAQINGTVLSEKQAVQKLATSEKALEVPTATLATAKLQLAESQKKTELADAEFKAATDANTAAIKNVELVGNEQKTVVAQLPNVTKVVADAEKRVKDLEAAAKTAETANGEAEKKVAALRPMSDTAAAEATKAQAAREDATKEVAKLKDDENAKDDQKKAADLKLKDLGTKADAAMAKATEAKKQLDAAIVVQQTAAEKLAGARVAVTAAATEVATAKAALDTHQKKIVAAAESLKTAQATAAQKKEAFDAKKKAATQAKQDLAKSQQTTQQSETNLKNLQNVRDNDLRNLAGREQALRDLEKALDEGARNVLAARAALGTANESWEQAKLPFGVKLEPVVGFSADWAGPEAREAIAKGNYVRWIPNMLQVPERLIDWSLFVREIQREYGARFDRWVFWENPDLDQAPQTLAPDRYRPLLEAFHRWVKLYNPKAKVIAGGFNFDKAARISGANSRPRTRCRSTKTPCR